MLRLTPLTYTIRPLTNEDEPLLWEMLYHAAHLAEEGETSVRAAMSNPDLARYVQAWGRPHDFGFAAIEGDSRQPVGAAWLRLLTGDNKGYAYVDEATPELAIAVLPDYTGQGVGTQLLARLLDAARQAYPSVCLSVRATNPAKRLYERFGFVPVSEVINRLGTSSLTMKVDFLNRNLP